MKERAKKLLIVGLNDEDGKLAALFEAVRVAIAASAALFELDAEAAIARAREFADAVPHGQEALVVSILQPHDENDWPRARAAALLWAFSRHAALAWAPRRVRVNALGLGVSPLLAGQPTEASGQAAGAAPAQTATQADIAATLQAIWRFSSMTGQLIRLGAP